MSYLRRQFALQSTAILTTAALAWPYYAVHEGVLPWGLLAIATGFCAGLLSAVSRQRLWWTFIHAVFVPLAWYVSTLRIPPGWFLLAFLSMWLLYRGALNGRIPLYLSNRHCADALIALSREHQSHAMLDLGAGFASVVRRLALARPDMHCSGIENAPLTWLIGWLNLRCRGIMHSTCDWRYGSLWNCSLSEFDLVYCFLSPEPMPDLWRKACLEMPPGSLLVSNSFPVPDIQPCKIIEVDDRRGSTLYCYQL